MNLINLFPLTILKDKIDISDDEKALMINEIRDMKKNSKNTNYQTKTNAWTGDTQGYEFIHKNVKFQNQSESRAQYSHRETICWV